MDNGLLISGGNMPVSFHIDASLGFAELHAHGVLTEQELLEMYENLSGDPAYHRDILILSDLSEVKVLDVSLTGIKMLFDRVKTAGDGRGQAKSAVVVNDRGHELFARMTAAQASHSDELPTVRIFDNRSEAMAWLGVAEGMPRTA